MNFGLVNFIIEIVFIIQKLTRYTLKIGLPVIFYLVGSQILAFEHEIRMYLKGGDVIRYADALVILFAYIML